MYIDGYWRLVFAMTISIYSCGIEFTTQGKAQNLEQIILFIYFNGCNGSSTSENDFKSYNNIYIES